MDAQNLLKPIGPERQRRHTARRAPIVLIIYPSANRREFGIKILVDGNNQIMKHRRIFSRG